MSGRPASQSLSAGVSLEPENNGGVVGPGVGWTSQGSPCPGALWPESPN